MRVNSAIFAVYTRHQRTRDGHPSWSVMSDLHRRSYASFCLHWYLYQLDTRSHRVEFYFFARSVHGEAALFTGMT